MALPNVRYLIRCRVQQAFGSRPDGDLRAGPAAHLVADVLDVGVYRPHAEEEPLRDLPVAQALGDQDRDLELARAEAARPGGGRGEGGPHRLSRRQPSTSLP